MKVFSTPPRMLLWAVLTIVFMLLANAVSHLAPSSLLAVTLYKVHLMSLGGWGGYWLDRTLFPYARPHELCSAMHDVRDDASPAEVLDGQTGVLDVVSLTFEATMQRRATIVAACLICVGLGA